MHGSGGCHPVFSRCMGSSRGRMQQSGSNRYGILLIHDLLHWNRLVAISDHACTAVF